MAAVCRVSEALNLVIADVNLEQGVLHIRNSKFGKERLVPMSESLTYCCSKYVSSVGHHRKDETAFFRHQRATTTFHTQFTMHGGRRFTMQGYLTVGKEKVRESMTYVTLSRFIVCRSGLRLARI